MWAIAPMRHPQPMTVADDLARRNGIEGEATTGQVLESLPRSFVVLDDRQLPGSDVSIEHLVIGPTGVFAVETETCVEGITISGGGDRSGGVEHAAQQAIAMSHVLEQAVQPVVVVHDGAGHGSLSSPVMSGVRLCSPSQLVTLLSDGEAVIEAHDVVSLALRASDRCIRRGRVASVATA